MGGMPEMDLEDILRNSQRLGRGKSGSNEATDAGGEAMKGFGRIGDAGLGESSLNQSENVSGDFVGIVEIEVMLGDGIAEGRGEIAPHAAEEVGRFLGDFGFQRRNFGADIEEGATMDFPMNLLTFKGFLKALLQPVGKARQWFFAGAEGSVHPRTGVGLPEVFEGIEGERGLVGIGVIEGAFVDSGPFANGVNGGAAVALLPHQVAKGRAEFFRRVRGSSHVGTGS